MKQESIFDNFQKIFIDKVSSNKPTNLIKANDTYNKLLKNGVIKKRGYTLRGIEDIHLLNVKFNKKS